MKTIVILFVFALLIPPCALCAADSTVQPLEKGVGVEPTAVHSLSAAPVSFTGTYKTIAGGSSLYTVILKQIGNKVTGSFSPGNGKILAGVVTGNKLTFQWTQDGGYEGNGEFTLGKDGKTLTGKSNALKPKQFSITWNTYEAPVASFSGTWDTVTNAKFNITLTISQDGANATGVYPSNKGKIEGTVSGRVLRFNWKSDGGTGSGRLVMDESGNAFSGTYNRGNNPDDVEFTWNGKRATEKAGEKGPPPLPKPFKGAWQGKLGETALLLLLQRSGDQVTGQLKVNSANFGNLKDGIVVDGTLRFTVMNANGKVAGEGELVMDAGGISFRGTILGTAASATYIGP